MKHINIINRFAFSMIPSIVAARVDIKINKVVITFGIVIKLFLIINPSFMSN